MINRLCYAILLLLLLTSPIAAQDDTAPLPVLDEAVIFADGVTVIERLPVLNFDNEARELYYYDVDSEQWQTHDYPSDLPTIRSIEHRSDGTSLIYTEDSYTFNSDVNPEYVWLFEPVAEQFSRPDSQCGRVKAEFGHGQWVLMREEQADRFYFCHTETGATTSILSSEIGELCEHSMNDALFSTLYSNSPDREWVVFTDCNQTYTPSDFGYRIYAYHPQTETYRVLGDTAQFESIEFTRWLDDTTLIIHGDTLGTQHDRYFYLADVTQDNSLTLVAEQYVTHPQYFTDPSRFIWFGWDTQNVYEYNLETRQSRQLASVGCESIFSFCVAIPNPDYTLLAIEDSVWQSDLPGHINIYTLPDGELVYSREYGGASGFSENDREVVWVDNNRFFASGYLIDVRDGTELTQFGYLNPDWLSPNESHYVVRDNSTVNNDLYIVNLSDFSEITIATINDENYDFRATWLSTMELNVAVSFSTSNRTDLVAEWHIRIDALDEDNS
jgi:hypothetical protein